MAALGYSASRESALGAPANIGALSSTSRTRTRRPVRRGELCGLQIRDVGLDRALVHVAFNELHWLPGGAEPSDQHGGTVGGVRDGLRRPGPRR